MKIAIITANLGNFEKYNTERIYQSIDSHFYLFNDSNFPPRYCSMTHRLQARIVKMFMWQFVPDYDYYLWVDSSCSLSHEDSAKWFLEKLGDKEIAVFKHPNRNTIIDEANYIKKRLDIKCPYITPRYTNELIDEQIREIKSDVSFIDNALYASTAFIYKNGWRIRTAMKEWWYHTSRYHSIDQLALPYVLWKNYLQVAVIKESYLKIPYLKYVR
jgi:hypothetical protein